MLKQIKLGISQLHFTQKINTRFSAFIWEIHILNVKVFSNPCTFQFKTLDSPTTLLGRVHRYKCRRDKIGSSFEEPFLSINPPNSTTYICYSLFFSFTHFTLTIISHTDYVLLVIPLIKSSSCKSSLLSFIFC